MFIYLITFFKNIISLILSITFIIFIVIDHLISYNFLIGILFNLLIIKKILEFIVK